MNEHSSYEISKRLHDKGFRAEHKHNWIESRDGFGRVETSICAAILSDTLGTHGNIPAYTFTELWGAMPEKITTDETLETLGFLAIWKVVYLPTSNVQQIVMCYKNTNYLYHVNKHKYPAECAALMVEWLLSNGHL